MSYADTIYQRPPLFDEEIEMMPVGEVVVLYYSLVNWKPNPHGDADFVPFPVISAGLNPDEAQANEQGLQQRIYRLRPELRTVHEWLPGVTRDQVSQLTDYVSFLNSGLYDQAWKPVLLDMSQIRTIPPSRPSEFGMIWYGVLSAVATGGVAVAVKAAVGLGQAAETAAMAQHYLDQMAQVVDGYNRGVLGNFELYGDAGFVFAQDWVPANFVSLAAKLKARKDAWVMAAGNQPGLYSKVYWSPSVADWMDAYESLVAQGTQLVDYSNVVSPSQVRGGQVIKPPQTLPSISVATAPAVTASAPGTPASSRGPVAIPARYSSIDQGLTGSTYIPSAFIHQLPPPAQHAANRIAGGLGLLWLLLLL